MARIISQINPETGRRQKVASVEGKTVQERTQNLAESLGTTQKKASRFSNQQILKKIQPSSIPLTTLSSTETPAVAPKAPVSAPAPIDSMLTALPETLKAQRQQTQKAEESSFEALMAEALGQETPSAIRARIEKEKGIQELDLQATELANQITAEQEALRKKIEQVETAPGTATLAERDREIAELTRVSRRQQADLAITQLVAQGRLDSARRFADTLVQAEVEEGTKRINLLQMAYERKKELFTKAEQREFETMQADRERQLDQETYELKARFDQKIKGETTGSGGINIPQFDTNGNPLEYGTDAYYENLFAGSAGGRPLTGEQTTPLTKASIVLNQVAELQAQIQDTPTDPILGILRDNNPYDVKARLIQAQLRATVPNLARGVYGEVGVLTDTDIENYIRTLPNLRTPEQANKLILAMTLNTVKNTFRSYLEANANAGRDVSGYLQQYKAINERIDNLKEELGVGTLTPEKETDIYDSSLMSIAPPDRQSTAGQAIGGFFDSVFNSFFGR